MPITINGSGTIAGLQAGGLPDNSILTADIADANITSTKLSSTGRLSFISVGRTAQHSLAGDSGWVDHLSTSITCGVACRIWMFFGASYSYESGAVQGFGRFVVDGTAIGYNWCMGKQSTANAAGSGSGCWYADVTAGAHTILVQIRNSQGASTWISPYYSVDGNTANTLGVLYYA